MVAVARSHLFDVHDEAKVLGFGFVEFATQDSAAMGQLFRSMGFVLVAKHRRRAINVYRQGDIYFIIRSDDEGFSAVFAKLHGPSVSGFSFLFEDGNAAWEAALTRGAPPIESSPPLDFPAIEGVGGSRLYLIDAEMWARVLDQEFTHLVDPSAVVPGFGLKMLDHLTHNVKQGAMDPWAEFYEQVFNFEELRFFEIKGKQTGLRSRAMVDPTNVARIPINESQDDSSQIEEYLRAYHGEGIQHIALSSDDIYATVEAMRGQGVKFLEVPDTYFEALSDRIPGHDEDLQRLSLNRILMDGGPDEGKGLLLQIFTQTVIGPVFFEIIQRKGNDGFGDGNFQALFESIERDQIKRGVLKDE
ncbi:MAG: 4-hydroxyphenylpyruvate dioxygenase [Magnetovibrio sp.]|nr:4-hydroxyphenylpyruvate dioxygenase [Magnetovibrio sp.]